MQDRAAVLDHEELGADDLLVVDEGLNELIELPESFGRDALGDGGRGSHVQRLGRRLNRQPAKIAEFDNFRLAGVQLFEFRERLIERQDVLPWARSRECIGGDGDSVQLATRLA